MIARSILAAVILVSAVSLEPAGAGDKSSAKSGLAAVTNARNGRSVVVRINDRGPFTRGRVIDVTPAAANQLGFSGLVPVNLEVLEATSGTSPVQ
jgi:rare lipoprotein A